MKRIIIYLLLVFGCSTSTLLSAQEFIEPCEMEFLSEYYSGVDNIIDRAVNHSSELSLTVIPSFVPEYGVRLVGNKIYFVEFTSSFWTKSRLLDESEKKRTSSLTPKIKTKIHSASLDPLLGARITQVYKSAISNARPSNVMGLDGVSYRFSLPSVGCGTTWSPELISPNGRLVSLLELLISHSKLSLPSDIQQSENFIAKFLNNIDGGV